MEKAALRKRHRSIRKAIAGQRELYQEKSILIQSNLLRDALWEKFDTVVLYCAFGGEVDTNLLLETAWSQGKRVCLPRCLPEKNGLMNLHFCAGLMDLEAGAYGIMEPNSACPLLESAMLADVLLVVPGLAFDGRGFRLGYGGGYYDRLLGHGHGVSVGLCFTDNLERQLPREEWDIPVKAVCTEEKLFWV